MTTSDRVHGARSTRVRRTKAAVTPGFWCAFPSACARAMRSPRLSQARIASCNPLTSTRY
eukprot:2646647-Rhodomonas_salina.2